MVFLQILRSSAFHSLVGLSRKGPMLSCETSYACRFLIGGKDLAEDLDVRQNPTQNLSVDVRSPVFTSV